MSFSELYFEEVVGYFSADLAKNINEVRAKVWIFCIGFVLFTKKCVPKANSNLICRMKELRNFGAFFFDLQSPSPFDKMISEREEASGHSSVGC